MYRASFIILYNEPKNAQLIDNLLYSSLLFLSRNSSVGIATGYGLDGPEIESRWGRNFRHLSRPTLRPTQPPVQWVPGLARGHRAVGGLMLTPHPLLVLWSRKSRAIPLLPLWALRSVQSLSACTRVHFTFCTLWLTYVYLCNLAGDRLEKFRDLLWVSKLGFCPLTGYNSGLLLPSHRTQHPEMTFLSIGAPTQFTVLEVWSRG